MQLRFFISLPFIIIFSFSYGQSWLVTTVVGDSTNILQPTTGNNRVEAILMNSAGNLIVGGKCDDYPILMEMTTSGDTLWTNDLVNNSYPKAVVEVSDGYIWAIQWGAILVKMDFNGNYQWIKNYSANSGEDLKDMVMLSDSSLMVVSDAYDFSLNSQTGIAIHKIDLNGNLIWTKHYRETLVNGLMRGNALLATENGGFVVAGYTQGTYGYGSIILQFDSNGNIENGKRFFDASEFNDIIQKDDSTYLAVGKISIVTPFGSDPMLLTEIDTGLNLLRAETYGIMGTNYACSIIPSDSNGWLISGDNLYEQQVVEIDNNYDLVNAKHFSTQSTGYGTIKLFKAGTGGYYALMNNWAYYQQVLVPELYNHGFGFTVAYIDNVDQPCWVTDTIAYQYSLPVEEDSLDIFLHDSTCLVTTPGIFHDGIDIWKFDGCQWIYDVIHIGVEENEQPEFSMYPNPADDKLWVKSELNIPSLISIYDSFGRKVLGELYKGEHAEIDVSIFSPGLYFVQIENNRKKLIIE